MSTSLQKSNFSERRLQAAAEPLQETSIAALPTVCKMAIVYNFFRPLAHQYEFLS